MKATANVDEHIAVGKFKSQRTLLSMERKRVTRTMLLVTTYSSITHISRDGRTVLENLITEIVQNPSKAIGAIQILLLNCFERR